MNKPWWHLLGHCVAMSWWLFAIRLLWEVAQGGADAPMLAVTGFSLTMALLASGFAFAGSGGKKDE